jgi:hypothetical protein
VPFAVLAPGGQFGNFWIQPHKLRYGRHTGRPQNRWTDQINGAGTGCSTVLTLLKLNAGEWSALSSGRFTPSHYSLRTWRLRGKSQSDTVPCRVVSCRVPRQFACVASHYANSVTNTCLAKRYEWVAFTRARLHLTAFLMCFVTAPWNWWLMITDRR